MNKDEALRQWLTEHQPFVSFDILNAEAMSYAVSPVSVTPPPPFISKQYQAQYYDFGILAMFGTSTIPDDQVNTSNTDFLRQWQQWIETQEQNGNYPDFGETCSAFELINLSNMPILAQKFEDGTGKYQFFARLTYLEERI